MKRIEIMHRRKVLKGRAGAATLRPTCLSAAMALASEKKPATEGRGAKGAESAPHWEYMGEAGPDSWGCFRHPGSPTTPPCSQKVIWSVFDSPVEMSTDQVRQFAPIFAMNARPAQGLQRRILLESL